MEILNLSLLILNVIFMVLNKGNWVGIVNAFAAGGMSITILNGVLL